MEGLPVRQSSMGVSSTQKPSLTRCLVISIILTSVRVTSNNVTASTPLNYSLPIDVTVVTIEIANALKHHCSLPRVLPMMDMALEHVRELYKGRINYHLVPGNGSCNQSVVGATAADIRCKHNISVFIGPTCSNAAMTIGYLASDWNVPILTNGNSASIGNKDTFPTLVRVSHKVQSVFAYTMFSLMEDYNWKNFVLFYDNSNEGTVLSDSFKSHLRNSKYRYFEYKLDFKKITLQSVKTDLIEAATRARVFVLIIFKYRVEHQFWLAASQLGYATSGEFAWLKIHIPVFKPSSWNTWNITGYENYAKILQPAFAQVLFFHMDDAGIQIPKDVYSSLINRSLDDYGFNYTRNNLEPIITYLGYWNALVLYSLAVNETLEEGGDPYDGRGLANKMKNRSFEGMTRTIFMNENGDRNAEVKVYALEPRTEKFEIVAMKFANKPRVEFLPGGSFPWPYNGGKPPLNEPVCGYMGQKCFDVPPESGNSQLVMGVSIFFGLAVVIGSIAACILWRRWKKQSERDLWWWLIDPCDLKATNERRATSLVSLSSKMDNASSKYEVGSVTPTAGTLAVFKGEIVRTQKFNIKQPKTNELILNDFKKMREISHNNLVRLYGASVEDGSMSLVTEHCSKGTLQDLLGNGFISLDAQFKFSLCTDIINGLCYLHGSSIKFHSRLNSEICCLDNRFTVKLSDFGLTSIYSEKGYSSSSCQEYINGNLWRAPEFLRSFEVSGSKEGDIYSFGIILSEVISRDSPFSNETSYMTVEEVLDKIRMPNQNPFRPVVEVPSKLVDMKTLMERCWSEDPKLRPSVNAIKSEIKRIAKSLGETSNLLDNLLRRMEQYANNLEKLVEEKTVELRDEKKRSEELLYQILPRSVADRLKAGLRVEPEEFDCVTIYFSDIVGFTVISAASTPIQIVDLLNDLYSCFDAILEEFDVYKVETIGDAYMVVSGLPQRNGSLHAVHIARMSLKLLDGISSFKIKHQPDVQIKLRIGLHSGPVCAGVVGQKMPRYCLFGDTVNTASRMESHGEALKIHMSDDCNSILELHGNFVIIPRGETEIKGKGIMSTYWLTGDNS